MNKIIAIAKKELAAFFKSPTATIVLVVTISAFNVFFYLIIGERKEASLHEVFKVMEFFFIFDGCFFGGKAFGDHGISHDHANDEHRDRHW